MFDLSQDFKQRHYLTGMLLTELSTALNMESEGWVTINKQILYIEQKIEIHK